MRYAPLSIIKQKACETQIPLLNLDPTEIKVAVVEILFDFLRHTKGKFLDTKCCKRIFQNINSKHI